MNRKDWRLAIMIIPIYLILLFLIFSVSFLWLHILDPELQETEPDNLLLIGLDNIAFNTVLDNSVTDQNLITFYEEPAEDSPYILISYTYTTEPTTLTFKITDENDNQVSGSPSTIRNIDGYIERRYPFVDNGSESYSIKYSLSGSNDVSIIRIELKGAATSL